MLFSQFQTVTFSNLLSIKKYVKYIKKIHKKINKKIAPTDVAVQADVT